MILSEKQKKALNVIESLRKRIDLLDSHKVVGFINDKQYAESLKSISEEIDRLEKEFGLEPTKLDAYDFLHNPETIGQFKDSISRTNDLIASLNVEDDEIIFGDVA